MSTIRDTRPQEAMGIATVMKIVQGRAKHGWQKYDTINDKGIDGLIIYRKNHGKSRIDTGELVFVQVKCGTGKGYFKESKNRPKHFGVLVTEEYIKYHRPIWNRLFGPVIMVYVDYDTEKAWWTDLRDESSYSAKNKSIILFPKSQRFGIQSFGEFKRLKGHLHINPDIKHIQMARSEVSYFDLTKGLKDSAREFYRQWANSNERVHPELGEIIVSREGWRHICRKGRKPERIIQSWALLGTAKKMIQTVNQVFQLRLGNSKVDASGYYTQIDYISLRAQVEFPQRHGAIIQVVLKRRRRFDSNNTNIESKIWFHSVYEPFAKKRIR